MRHTAHGAMLVLAIVGQSPAGLAGDYQLGSILIEEPWGFVADGLAAGVGSAYLTIVNYGDVEDVLVSATSPAAQQVDLVEIVRHDSDAQELRTLDAGIAVPSGGVVVLQPGAPYVQLQGMDTTMEIGRTFPLTLAFAASGSIEVDVPIKSIDDVDFGGMPGDCDLCHDPRPDACPYGIYCHALED